MQVRAFNQKGIAAFSDWLEECRQNPAKPLCTELLENDALTQPRSPECHAAKVMLTLKRDAAVHLLEVLSPMPDAVVATDAGLWTWLTLRYFDSVCPAVDGLRSVKNDYYYVFEPNNARHSYRHLLFVSWQIRRIAPDHNRLMLMTPLNSLDAVSTEVMKRLYLTRIPCIFEVLDTLYWDAERTAPRKGITRNIPTKGNLRHRLPIRIQQLEKTFDLQSVTASQLIDLLGDEFSSNIDQLETTES
ncbi:MAG: hypothetical protein MI725_17555 [Pirellulales bacterium]|nr:hypothetical protein [Pirellulales bacterium]